jgi:hypothetical protein
MRPCLVPVHVILITGCGPIIIKMHPDDRVAVLEKNNGGRFHGWFHKQPDAERELQRLRRTMDRGDGNMPSLSQTIQGSDHA